MMLKVAVHKEDECGNVYTLLEDLVICWNGKVLVVPAGFESDGASVPRFFWRAVFPPGDSRALRIAIVHDFIYRTHPEGWSKAEADTLFYEGMREDGVPFVNAKIAYYGVYLFGKSSWEAGKYNKV
jgi:hypothetical protein